MNFLSWILALSILLTTLWQAVSFQEATVCRQNAWLKSTELKTRQLLDKPLDQEVSVIPKCRIFIKRDQQKVFWYRLPTLKKHRFEFELEGKL